ncbi:TPR and ankyrin repeat-containing protein 1-like [Mercenaria mercenaria]|uniref:TPR and ankyrin repeat-containing protein 1-like n=1 Tax=Mercenaria mercenaria TaxID=6596 RepID=UPI00234F35FD|nr:TPR and ankyrin repeat-containing protein 1-like [Mercenaria mercenaria]
MPRMRNEERALAIGMLKAGVSRCQVARVIGRHVSTIRNLRNKFVRTGNVADEHRKPRPRVTSHRQDRFVVLQLLRSRFKQATITASTTVNRYISAQTVRNRLREQGIRARHNAMVGNGRHGHVWAQVCYLLVRNNDWESASGAYHLFKINLRPITPLKLDLKPFCSIKDIRSNPWVADIMLYLSHCGSNKRSISLEEGDTYLHAAVKISLVEKQKTPTNQAQNRSNLHKAKTISQNIKAKRNQGRAHTCEKCERIYSNAVEKLTANITDGLKLLVEVLNMDHSNQQHIIIEKKALGDFSKHIGELSLEDASICLDSLRKEKYFTIIDVLVCDKRWLLLELTIQKSKKLFAEGELKEFASKFTVEPLVRDTSLDSEEEKHRVVLNLLENGWRIADDNGKMVVKNAVELKEFKVAIELINRGADSSMISMYSGDTPIHAAILIALQEKHVPFIQALLDKQVGDKDKYTYLDPEQVDANGDGIYHLLAKADFNDFVLRLTKMLCSRMVSAKYYNKELKYPNDYVKERDSSLFKLLEEASRIKPSHEKVVDKKLKKDEKIVSPKEIEVSLESKSKHPPKMLTEQIEETKKRIETLIIALPKSIKATYVERQNLEIAERDKHINNENSSFSEIPAVLSMVDITENKANTDHESKGDIENKRTMLQKERIFQKEIEQNISEHEIILTENDSFSRTETQKRREGARSKTLEDIADSVSFAPKDVEEYDHVSESELALLEDNDISELPPLESDEGIVDKTPQNMESDVSVMVTRRQVNIDENDHDSIDIIDEDDDLELENMFESLTWEVEYTDKVRKTLENKHVLPALRRKIIQIIRRLANGDWQNNYCRELTNVPKCLKLFEANLSKGRRIIWERAISFSSRCSDIADQRLNLSTDDALPQVNGGKIYTEVIRIWDIVMDHNKINRSVDKIKHSRQRGETCVIQRKLKGLKKENDQRRKANDIEHPLLFTEHDTRDDLEWPVQVQHSPSASPNKTEYNIVKFYTWDRAIERHILQNSSISVEFPFKVTEKEDAIIHLSGKGPILLLGRSGTGKTTCCLYRLWNQYNKAFHARLILRSEKTQENSLLDAENDESNDNRREQTNEIEKEGDVKTCKRDTNMCGSFHQLFVTKNHVLAAEVKKTFCGFLNADESISRGHTERHNQVLPNRLQDLQEHAFPLFLTSRQLLCKLDASLGDSFFSREEDGSLKYPVDGWADTEEEFDELNILDYDSADEDFDDIVADQHDEDTSVNIKRKNPSDARKEVTYEVFENEIWPKLESKTNAVYHPSLIWTEIMSFIKGSYESLFKTNGYLSKDEYEELGRKRAPNFSGKRQEVYHIFKLYEHVKRQHGMFDETDVVRSVFQRLTQSETSPVAIHQIYVDETQDFTQAELFLLIRLCQNPNNMFLTGDTAQGIMRGISFRFEDLKLLFYHVNQEIKEASSKNKTSKYLTVDVPKKVHKLIYNYRSHSGIVSLASSIMDILGHFFKESFDIMDPDKGLLPGPEPILLESCSLSDLAVLLRGNKRKTPTIEFGAHQVILVYDEEARDSLPEELSCGLVLTIFESKGLEFDDVLLYNFFKDSQASKEWRVVTKHLEKLASEATNKSLQQNETCVMIDQDVLSSKDRPRPLEFDPNQHKILNYELKQLYTALTRARVNVWIFDEDKEKRSPMFEYFKARKLVKSVEITELNEENLSNTIFVEKSSMQDWIQRGDYFLKKRLYSVATKCFRKGGDHKKEMLAQANDRALVASRRRYKVKEFREMKADFLFAAEMYLKCEHLSEAAKCLGNAKEVKLATDLYEKLGQYDKAVELCKRNRQFVECSSFYERSGKFSKAVSILYENERYGLALDVVNRYKMKEMEIMKNGNRSPEELRANRPDAIYTEEKICQRAAEEFHRRGNTKRMHEAVSRFRYEGDKIEFYKRNRYISDAANKLASTGRIPEAVDLYLKYGNLTDARDMAETSKDDKQIAKCLLVISRITIADKPQNYDEVKKDLEKALSIFKTCGDRDLSGQVMLLQAKLYNDVRYVMSAGKEFSESRRYINEAGYVECCNVLKDFIGNFIDKDYRARIKFLLKGADCLFKMCSNLLLKRKSSYIDANVEAHFQAYWEFYGIVQQLHGRLVTFPRTKPLCSKMLQDVSKSNNIEFPGLENDRNIHMIVHYLLKESKPWLTLVKVTLLEQRDTLQRCRSFQLGRECTNNDCRMIHAAHKPYTYKDLIETDLLLAEYETYTNEADGILRKYRSSYSPTIKAVLGFIKSAKINENDKYRSCHFILKDLLQETGHPLILAEDSSQFLKPIRTNKLVLKHIKHYLLNRWHDSISGGKKIKSKAVYETEVFLLFEFSYHLFHYYTWKFGFKRTPKQEMLNFENTLNSELLKDGNSMAIEEHEQNYTVMITLPDKNSQNKSPFITCVAHWFTDAYEHLTSGDPFQAVLSFGKFQTLLSQRKLQDRSKAGLYPDVHHYLLWLEFYTSLAFFLIASMKSQVNRECTFILPNNYLALMHFIESTFPKGLMPIKEAISGWAANNKKPLPEIDIFDRVKGFAFVISGQAQKMKLLKIILKKCQENDSNYVLLERFLILNMTMLCNIGNSVPVVCEEGLVHSAHQILSMSGKSKRLMTILEEEEQFKGIKHIADCPEKFLRSRSFGEKLLAIQWTPQQQGRYTVLPLDATSLPSTFLKEKSVEPDVEMQDFVEECLQDDELTEEETKNTETERYEIHISEAETQEQSATNIDIVSSNYTLLDTYENENKENYASSIQVTSNDIFLDSVWINEQGCYVCGVSFESSCSSKEENENSAETKGSHAMNKLEDFVHTEKHTQRQDSQIDNDTYTEMLVKAKMEHENDPLHFENIVVFKRFKNMYEIRLKPLINLVRDFLENKDYNLSDETYISKHFEKYKEEIQRMKINHDRLETEYREICRERKWSAKQECLDQIAEELQSDMGLIKPYVEEQTLLKHDKQGAVQTKENAAFGEEKDVDENDFECVVPEPVTRTKKYKTKKERRDIKKQRGKKR